MYLYLQPDARVCVVFGTRGDIFGTGGNLVVVCKASLVLALVQSRILALDLNFDQGYIQRKSKCL